MLKRIAVGASLAVTPLMAMAADETATNAIDGIVGTATYARTTVVPIALGLVVLVVGVKVGKKLWTKLFGAA